MGGTSVNVDAGSLFGDIFGLFGGPDTREADAASARSIEATRIANEHTDRRIDAQRRWSEGMSNTGYERNVASMRRAGINPAVALSGGGGGPGATTPSVGTPGAQADIGVSTGIASARAATDRKRYRKEMAALAAQTTTTLLHNKLLKSQAKKTDEEANTTKLHGFQIRNQGYLTFQQEELARAHAASARADNVIKEQRAAWYRKHPMAGSYSALTRVAGGTAQTIAGAVGLRGLMKGFRRGAGPLGGPKKFDWNPKGSWGSNH